jgi:hypothetical protein
MVPQRSVLERFMLRWAVALLLTTLPGAKRQQRGQFSSKPSLSRQGIVALFLLVLGQRMPALWKLHPQNFLTLAGTTPGHIQPGAFGGDAQAMSSFEKTLAQPSRPA